jgi:uncharacterized membrane protein YkoI
MRMIPAVLTLGLCAVSAGCGREPKTDTVADSLRVAYSVQLAGRTADSVERVRAAARSTPRPGEVIVKVTEQVPGLLAEAKYLPIDAQHLAQTKYPTGEVKSAAIERRGGDLVYIYEIQQKDVEGSELVLVDAMNGTLISSMHKDAAVAESGTKPKPKTP